MNRLETLLQMAANKPDDAFLQYAIALEHVALQDMQAAENIFQSLLSLQPNYLPTYYQYGQLLETVEKTEQARHIYEQGIALALKLNDNKTARELQQAIDLLED
jgi:tetratricopeptide (TPR) repeat protein